MLSGAIIHASEVNLCCLSEISSRDKPWDIHKRQSKQVSTQYRKTGCNRYAQRIDECADRLEFAFNSDDSGESFLKLFSARFCRVRHCPICQWRRSLMWMARLHKALPKLLTAYPDCRFIFLTLTVKNCPLADLRSTLTWMNRAWKRLSEKKQFPAQGFVKSVEVTRSKDNQAHPHFHCLLAVPSSYFVGRKYLSQAKWSKLWAEALRLDYTPIVHVTTVKPKLVDKAGNPINPADGLIEALREVFKYSVKPEDLINSSPEWIEELTKQLHKTRAVSLGGIFREYLSEEEPEDLIKEPSEENIIEGATSDISFGWRDKIGKYLLDN